MGRKAIRRKIEAEKLRFWTAKADSAEIERDEMRKMAMQLVGGWFSPDQVMSTSAAQKKYGTVPE